MSIPKRTDRGARRLTAADARRLVLVGLALILLVAPLPAGTVEAWYSRGAYAQIQRVLTPITNLTPFAWLDLAGTLAILAWVGQVRKAVAAGRSWRAWRDVAGGFSAFVAILYLVFLALWGLNYRRVPLEQKVVFDPGRITRESALRVAAEAVRQVNQQEAGAPEPFDAAGLRRSFDAAQRLLGARVTAVPGRPKRSLLAWYFRWAAIDGMTDPFFLEIIVNPDVLPIERPFVVAHEWAHLAGYADESEANFVAWLTCLQGDAWQRYSGWLTMYVHVTNALSRQDRAAMAATLGPVPRRDLAAIGARLQRSAPVVRDTARDVYDRYLKANRVPGGIASYDAVVRLVLGTRFGEGWTPALKHEALAGNQ